jgi:hypothetical protein
MMNPQHEQRMMLLGCVGANVPPELGLAWFFTLIRRS